MSSENPLNRLHSRRQRANVSRQWNRILKIGSTTIENTFAEAFSMKYCRIIVTARNKRWLNSAVVEFSGYGSSVIGCDAEVGLENYIPETETLDGRPGASLLLFGFSTEAVQKALANRTGQSLMTCPTTAVFDGLRPDPVAGENAEQASVKRVALGQHLRFFGDGFQKSKLIGNRRFWRIPVMDGEFLIEDSVSVAKGVAGGNFLILAADQSSGLNAAERAVDAIAQLKNVIAPFPGGVVRSGSKVGSKYAALRASTSDAYCPTLRGRVDSQLPPSVSCVYEIVIDGTDVDSVANAMKVGIESSIGPGVVSISAGNYGGKLGKHHFHLASLFSEPMD